MSKESNGTTCALNLNRQCWICAAPGAAFNGRRDRSGRPSQQWHLASEARQRWDDRRSSNFAPVFVWVILISLAAAWQPSRRAAGVYKNMKGDAFESPIRQVVLHVVNNGTHHQGQVAGFLRSMGHPRPPLELIAYYRQL